MKELFNLFIAFAKVGVLTFGGGYAMLPILQREIVEKNNWESEYGHSGDREYIEGFGTPDGRVRVIVGNIKEIGPGDDLQCITLDPSLIDLSKVSLNGVTLDNVETLKNSSNLIEEDSESFEISVADYVTLNVTYNSGGELKTIKLIRQNYCYR